MSEIENQSECCQLGEKIYASIPSTVIAENEGRVVSIDIDTGSYLFADSLWLATKARGSLRQKYRAYVRGVGDNNDGKIDIPRWYA